MHIGFYSTIALSAWGGSEELWSQTAATMLRRGHRVSINVASQNASVPQLENLRNLGADIYRSNRRRFGRQLRGLFGADLAPYKLWLSRTRPDFVLISMSWHLDDLTIAQACASMKIPYGVLVQAASPYQWIGPRLYESHRRAFTQASACYFVSTQNREIVESNLALNLSNASIVDNAFNVASDVSLQWPAEDTWKLACVARINFQSKGQDLLLRVLKQPKWKSRPLQVSLWGVDEGNLQQVKDTIKLYDLGKAVTIGGFSADITSVWATHHGLILPSRYEGNSLAMIEAMICGRIPIVTDVGRVRELVDDNRSGFIAPAPTADMLDEAMERAWNRRHEWQAMGALATTAIKTRHSMRPAEDFTNSIVHLSGRKGYPSGYARNLERAQLSRS